MASQCQCNAGYYGATCDACPVAYYCPGGASSYPCPNNGYTLLGASLASQCMCPDNSAANASGICKCAPGYQHIADSGSPAGWRCDLCAANSYCVHGIPYQCPAGSASVSGSSNYSACICAAPTYLSLPTTCSNCSVNHYYVSNTQCGACPANSYSPVGSASFAGCICANGMYMVGTQCAACPAGFSCQNCVATPCPANSYCASGASAPTACPALSTAPLYSNSSSACQCGDGYYMNGGVCSLCGYGTYAAMGTVGACSACPANSNTSTIAAVTASQCFCVAGYYGDASSCAICPANSYCSGGQLLTQCPNSTYSTQGSASVSQCKCIPHR